MVCLCYGVWKLVVQFTSSVFAVSKVGQKLFLPLHKVFWFFFLWICLQMWKEVTDTSDGCCYSPKKTVVKHNFFFPLCSNISSKFKSALEWNCICQHHFPGCHRIKGTPVEDKQICRRSWARFSHRENGLFTLGSWVCHPLIKTVRKESLMVSRLF